MPPDRRPMLVDVRTPEEHAADSLGPDAHIPLDDLPSRLGELDPSRPIVVYCRSGRRSAIAVRFLLQNGFALALNLEGGIRRYREEFGSEEGPY